MVAKRNPRRSQQGQGGRVIDTGLRPLWTQKSTTPIFIALTEALDTTHIKEVRGSAQLVGPTANFKGRIAYRMSNDGVTWSATVTDVSSYATAAGWVFNDGTVSSLTTDQMLYVQLGLQAANVSGTEIEFAMAQIYAQVRDLKGRTVYANQEKVWSDGTTTAIFNALTDEIPIESTGEIRATLELITHSGDLQVQPGYQVSNDGKVWYSGAATAAAGTFATFGANRSTNGITYGTTFAAFAPDEKKKLIRFGVAGKNGSAGLAETGLVNLRVDARRS